MFVSIIASEIHRSVLKLFVAPLAVGSVFVWNLKVGWKLWRWFFISKADFFLDKISTGSALNPVFGLSSSGCQTFCQYHQDCVNERLIGSQIRVEESSIKATCSSLAVTLLKYRRQKNRVASLAFSGRLLSVLGDFFFFWRVLVLFAECRDCATCCVCQLFGRFDVYWSIIVVWMVLDWWPLWANGGSPFVFIHH